MASVRSIAAANNAEWCDLVCRTHGLDPVFERDAWTSPTRTPPYYPDAVTLEPDVSAPELLARVDSGPGCSIKDSFAVLDLTEFGFRVLFDAEWIVRAPTGGLAPSTTAWRVVREQGDFETWGRAWGRDAGEACVLTVDLLGEPSVRVLAGQVGDDIMAGAVLNSSDRAVGISNLFADPGAVDQSWEGCLALASTLFPDAMLVGYESGDALERARAHGFSVAGPLRVWNRDA